jgi:hypothetical protein
VELFVSLERVPPLARRTDEFKDRDRALAAMLGLEVELICSVASVLDRSASREARRARQVPCLSGAPRVDCGSRLRQREGRTDGGRRGAS